MSSARAVSIPCAVSGCPELSPCPTHGSSRGQAQWSAGRNSRIRHRSGSAEQRLNRWVMARWHGVCHVCNQPGADQVDHVVPLSAGGSDGWENRRPIHSAPCHADKSAAERRRGLVR